jgi:hypothetical protein
MPILNPDHLFEQADRLIVPPPAGPPRQVDLRRAISSAYYGVFHATLIAAADEFVGVTKRSDVRYALVYRSIDHKMVAEVCAEAKKSRPSARYARYSPAGGFASTVQSFAAAALELQEKRHAADYDPSIRINRANAKLAVDTARTALERFQAAPAAHRRAFLSLLVFRPR